MDKLPADKQADIEKTSSQRLGRLLIQAGMDEALVDKMERPQLISEWAE
jgi:hypothetical protein